MEFCLSFDGAELKDAVTIAQAYNPSAKWVPDVEGTKRRLKLPSVLLISLSGSNK
jgi:hypothetical protein